MLELPRLASVVDELWDLTRDGRWHSRSALARRSSFEPDAVNAAVGFLVKYGFAQSSGGTETRIRLTGGPSPGEVARALSVLAYDDGQRFICS
jgi:hypothetical protein